MVQFKFNSVLVLTAHPDDAELACGATVARLVAEGSDVHSVVFTPAIKSLQPGWPRNIRATESLKAADILNITCNVLDFETREFPRDRQKILDIMFRLRELIDPDLVITHGSFDYHQDHLTVSAEAVRAFRRRTILGANHAWGNAIGSVPNFFVKLEHEHVMKQIEAVQCHRTQSSKDYCNPHRIECALATTGTAIAVEYAQAFQVLRVAI